MRRKEREVTEQAKITAIIQNCDCLRLALADEGAPYIVPVSFGFDEGKKAFYFHGAKKGRKMELIRKNGAAGFELDCRHALKEADMACGYSYFFQSVIGTGEIHILEDMEEKKKGLCAVMAHYTGKENWEFPEKTLAATAVLRLDVAEMSCKENM